MAVTWLLAVCLGGGAAAQEPEATIFPRPVPTRLAVADFQPKTVATAETNQALQVFNQVLQDDLKFSALFEIPSKSFYPLRPLRQPADVDFETWKTPNLDVDFLAFGNLQADSTAVVVEAYLYDVKTRQQVLGKRFRVADPNLVRRVAHEFADQVVYELSAGATRGVARTQIAFVSQRGDSKEIWIMDYDGGNARQLTFNGGLNKFPEWAYDGRTVYFTNKPTNENRWRLGLVEVDGLSRLLPIAAPYAASPAVAPDGRLAFSARTAGSRDTDIFVANPDGSGMRNITNSPGIDTSPTWSPTGRQIAFVSDRTGSPQIWIMDADGSNLRRLITEGGHCDSPDWSPDGRFILYSWQAPEQWKHDIFLVEVATGRIHQLTRGSGSYESPHWSPDGRHITFQSTRTGSKQIFIMNVDGKNLRQVTAYGANESPTWMPYPAQPDGGAGETVGTAPETP
ncbi:MAG: Tol-Pal system beta propeller repeat protein TolB [Acidobacteriota bacterium]